MPKSKQNLKAKEFSDLAEAKVSEPGASKKNRVFSTKQSQPTSTIEPPHHKGLPKILLVLMFLAVFGAFSLAMVLDISESGDIEIDELVAKEIVVNINSQPQIVLTNAETVSQLLSELDIELGPNDYMDKQNNQPVEDGMSIWLRQSIPIKVVVDNQEHEIISQPITVAQALAKAGIQVDEDDYVSLPLLSYVYSATEVEVIRILVERETVEEYIEQSEREVVYDYLAPGARTTISEGSPGINATVYDVTYENGQEIDRVLVESKKVRDPVERVVGIGSATSSGTETRAQATAADGATFYYANSFTVEATAYTWTGNRTATGTWPKVGTIAVDPQVIPLGTRVYIEGYGFAVAEDTGGAVINNIVDLYMDSRDECISWGRRHVNIYILE